MDELKEAEQEKKRLDKETIKKAALAS